MCNDKIGIEGVYPRFCNKTLLLADKNMNGLWTNLKGGASIVVDIDNHGAMQFYEWNNQHANKINMTLNAVMKKVLGLDDVTFEGAWKYFVTPEMEIERIFNNLRFKYLKGIYLSRITNPQQYVKYTYNKAYQTLAGMTLYQGNVIHRKLNDSFWMEAGFTAEAKDQAWETEHAELQRVLSILHNFNFGSVVNLYAELIAMKPGFHELCIHDKYFIPDNLPTGDTCRDEVFRFLRNKGSLSNIAMERLPPEINKNNYISYAPCSITEGPFVFRKSISVSYCNEVKTIRSMDMMVNLKDKFHMLDYFHRDISTRSKLAELLKEARPFRKFIV